MAVGKILMPKELGLLDDLSPCAKFASQVRVEDDLFLSWCHVIQVIELCGGCLLNNLGEHLG